GVPARASRLERGREGRIGGRLLDLRPASRARLAGPDPAPFARELRAPARGAAGGRHRPPRRVSPSAREPRRARGRDLVAHVPAEAEDVLRAHQVRAARGVRAALAPSRIRLVDLQYGDTAAERDAF